MSSTLNASAPAAENAVPAHHNHERSAVRLYTEFWLFSLLCSLVRAIPLKTAYRLNRMFFRIAYWFDWKHRTRTESHLLYAGVAKNPEDARKLGLNVFRQFAMLVVEIFKADTDFDLSKVRLSGSQATLDRCFRGSGPRQNVILVTGHYGNWEIAGNAIARLSNIPLTSIMRSFSNPLVGEMILRNRRSPVHHLVDKKGGIRGVLKALKRKESVAILADQHAIRSEGVETTFFGKPCRTHTSPALLHLKTGVPIMPEMTRRLPGDNFEFEIVVGDLIEYQPTGDMEHDIQVVTQLYTTALEKMIRETPEQWLWMHRRWLYLNRHHHAHA